MPKRVLEESSSTPKAKKTKFASDDHIATADDRSVQAVSKLTTEEVDFPRGGGTSFTPLEVKAIRAEAIQEANGELFEVSVFEIFCNNSISNLSRQRKGRSRRNASLMSKARHRLLRKKRKTKFESNT